MSTLPHGLIDGPSKLATLNLDDNPWVCDCRLNWLILWLQSTTRVSRSAASTKLPICMEPFQYQGQRLTSLRPLKCEGEPLIYYLLPFEPFGVKYLVKFSNANFFHLEHSIGDRGLMKVFRLT